METIFVLSPPIEENDMSLREEDAGIESAALRYTVLQGKTNEFLKRAEDRHLSGTPGTVYLKKLGHRALTNADFETLVKELGTDEDRQTVVDFAQAQLVLGERLKTTRAIGMVLEQANITRDLFYKRAKRPDLWKPEEVTALMEVLDRLRV